MGFHPFRDGDVFSTFQNHMARLIEEIRGLENSYVLRTSRAELERFFLDKAQFEPLTLHTDDYHIEDQRSLQVDARLDPGRAFFPGDRPYHIPGTQLRIAIPFDGDPTFWRIRPSRYISGGYPEIDVSGNLILLTHQFADDAANPAKLREAIDRHVAALKDAVANLHRDVQQHNASVPGTIKAELDRKRQQAQAASGAVAAIGIPIKRKDQPATYVAPVTRRKLPIHRPVPSKDSFKPEPELTEDEYQHILAVMRSLSLVIERNPASFTTLDEESIRDHILLQLNGHYEGAATGETFNSNGKTDILIRVEDRNIFIAECKFWHGQKKYEEAIDQLLGYLTWRDCKCSLIVFNRQKNASGVAQKMHETMAAHSGHRKSLSHDALGNGRYVFVKESDPGRE
ncbi:MAG TPA: hypothetical protein VG944_16100, partial [Fimbriimonas sp.]|nr:hypothetical protein [Fimbriimonas sp.]